MNSYDNLQENYQKYGSISGAVSQKTLVVDSILNYAVNIRNPTWKHVKNARRNEVAQTKMTTSHDFLASEGIWSVMAVTTFWERPLNEFFRNSSDYQIDC